MTMLPLPWSLPPPPPRCHHRDWTLVARTWYEPVDSQLVLYGKVTSQRVHPRDFVQLTHSEAPERFWVQVVKHKDGVIWGIDDNSLIFVDWPQGKKIRFSMCRVFDVYAGEA